ncbi:Poly polymerase 1, partial [Oopsacas minuta]
MEEKSKFLAEYAKSSRAGCKGCKGNIFKDSLRIAEMVQSPHFDGKVPNWYHQSCFFKKKTIKSTADVGGYDSLKWEDQEKIQKKLMSVDGTNSAGAHGKHSVAIDHDYVAEYAKSNRSLCQGCGEKIEKDALRLGHMETSDGVGSRPVFVKSPRWHHVECFMKKREELEASNLSANNINGYSSLKKADKSLLEKELGKAKVAPKRSKEQTGAPPAKRTKEEQTELDYLKSQNEKIWKLIGILKKELTKQEMVGLLEDNNQFVPIGEQNIISSLSDSILF